MHQTNYVFDGLRRSLLERILRDIINAAYIPLHIVIYPGHLVGFCTLCFYCILVLLDIHMIKHMIRTINQKMVLTAFLFCFYTELKIIIFAISGFAVGTTVIGFAIGLKVKSHSK